MFHNFSQNLNVLKKLENNNIMTSNLEKTLTFFSMSSENVKKKYFFLVNLKGSKNSTKKTITLG